MSVGLRETNGSVRSFFTALLLALACATSGCVSVKLHSEARQQQGEDAKKAWGEVKLDSYFASERENLAKLLAEEIESTRRLAAVNRESEIRVIAAKPVTQLPCYFEAELRKLFPAPGSKETRDLCGQTGYYTDQEVADQLKTLAGAWASLRAERRLLRDIERATSFLLAMGVPAFTCSQLQAKPRSAVDAWERDNAALAKDAASRLRNVTELCEEADEERAHFLSAIQSVKSGTFRDYVDDWERAKRAMKRREIEVAAAQAQYAQALKAFNDELAKARPGKSTVDKAKALAPTLAGILQGIEAAQEVLGRQWASQERIDRLNDLLIRFETGEALDPDTASQAELVAAMLPTIADDAVAIGQFQKGVGLVSLLIQRDVEQGNLNTAKVLAAIQQKDLALREAIVVAALEQGITYLKARRQSALVMACDRPEEVGSLSTCMEAKGAEANNTFHKAWDVYDPLARKNLLESTTLYLDAFSRQQVKIHSMTAQYISLGRERNLALSEVNAAMWAGLISASVDQAADYAALGLKAEHFEKILHILGIFYIGYGVNK